jgi:hypothetical protein
MPVGLSVTLRKNNVIFNTYSYITLAIEWFFVITSKIFNSRHSNIY